MLNFGARDYSMRIWLNPDRMAQLGVTAADIGAAINAQNAQYAAGKIGAEPALPGQELVYTVFMSEMAPVMPAIIPVRFSVTASNFTA